MPLGSALSRCWFTAVHGRNLIYNTCWEDPRIDRAALAIGPDDRVLVITSAGCNALDYALDGPRRVHAVDVNPRQNALLELKCAGIRTLDFETFFALFGRGALNGVDAVYRERLRPALGPPARRFWDRRIGFFRPGRGRGSFYFRGTAGSVAGLVNRYVDRGLGIRDAVDALLDADSLDAQRQLYYGRIKDRFWTPALRWLCGTDFALAFLGVPAPQRRQVERDTAGGIARFIEACLDAVFGELPLSDNYFWRVYLRGAYSRDCCPEFLKPDNFRRLKDGLVDRIEIHTDTIQGFLERHAVTVSRFVLLDHMDWLGTARPDLLRAEWTAICRRAAPSSRVIWRSGGTRTDFVDPLVVDTGRGPRRLGELLDYHPALAAALHRRDRVHTYGSFHIADLYRP